MDARSHNLTESRWRDTSCSWTYSGPPLLLADAIAPLPELSLILQFAALGGAIGGVVAAHSGRRNSRAEASTITSAWAGLGLVVGVVVVFVRLVLA